MSRFSFSASVVNSRLSKFLAIYWGFTACPVHPLVEYLIVDLILSSTSVSYTHLENGIVIDDVLVVTNDKKELIGHVVKVTTEDGYGGDITLVVGIDTNDEITGIEVLSIDETVGLGMRCV